MRDRYAGRDAGTGTSSSSPGRAPGKRTLTERFPVQRRAQPVVPTTSPAEVQTIARRGVGGSAGPFPFLDEIQGALGADLSGVRAHTGGEAAEATEQLGATAYASGNDVAFGEAPSLHTAAHEATHVLQQRAGVHLAGGVGQTDDPYERHADAVADRVVRGESATALLAEMTGGHTTSAVQFEKPGGEGGDTIERAADLADKGLYANDAVEIARGGLSAGETAAEAAAQAAKGGPMSGTAVASSAVAPFSLFFGAMEAIEGWKSGDATKTLHGGLSAAGGATTLAGAGAGALGATGFAGVAAVLGPLLGAGALGLEIGAAIAPAVFGNPTSASLTNDRSDANIDDPEKVLMYLPTSGNELFDGLMDVMTGGDTWKNAWDKGLAEQRKLEQMRIMREQPERALQLANQALLKAMMGGDQRQIDQARAAVKAAGGDPGPAVDVQQIRETEQQRQAWYAKWDPLVAELNSATDDDARAAVKQKMKALGPKPGAGGNG